jgi:NAD(P)-dependent dehydrogenase (short-subunit alcohol dehydrogenase family)
MGVIIVSIDEHELPRLWMLMEEIFSEKNRIATLIWERARKNDAAYVSEGHEYMLIWARSKAELDAKKGWMATRPEWANVAGFAGTEDYAATKAAVVGYSKGAARDPGPRNLTVNVVQAGVMDTDMAAGSADKLPPSLMDTHAIRRMAKVEEVAAAIVFLVGPKAGYITGSVIDVNGGYLACFCII